MDLKKIIRSHGQTISSVAEKLGTNVIIPEIRKIVIGHLSRTVNILATSTVHTVPINDATATEQYTEASLYIIQPTDPVIPHPI